jgi:DNA-binding transcriptional regulator GbsR (MarR family)
MEGKRDIVLYMISKGTTIDEISDLIGISKTELQQITS